MHCGGAGFGWWFWGEGPDLGHCLLQSVGLHLSSPSSECLQGLGGSQSRRDGWFGALTSFLHLQLVAGIKYFLTMDMGSTSCRKTAMTGDRSVDLTTCPLAADGEQEVMATCPQPCPSTPTWPFSLN